MANYTKPHSFNIVLNSQQVSAASSGNTNDCTYEFNWTNIPQGKYEMSFSYKGQNNDDFLAEDIPHLFLSLNAVSSTYQASSQNGSVISQYIGALLGNTHNPLNMNYYAKEEDNCKVYFENMPTSGPIRVQVFDSNFITPFETIGGSPLADYILVLHFRQLR
jgi:hypothetical protein